MARMLAAATIVVVLILALALAEGLVSGISGTHPWELVP